MSIRKIRKQIHYHSSQRWGVTVVLLIIFGTILLSQYSSWKHVNASYDKDEHKAILEELQTKAAERAQTTKQKYSRKSKLDLIPFDPNTISQEQLMKMGIKESIAKSWTKYTSKGGKFYKPADLKKLYVMNDFLFDKLEPFIAIKDATEKGSQYLTNTKREERKYDNKQFDYNNGNQNSGYHNTGSTELNDSISAFERKEYNENFKASRKQKSSGLAADYIITLNSTDSIELQMLDGIGPVLSSRIIKYRDQLGGFHNMNQLLEVYGVKPALLSAIKAKINFDGNLIQIDINNITVDSLVKHPYFDYSTANIFINYREHHGPYRDLNDVKKIIAIKQYWLDEIAPYFRYNIEN